jgi:hypothetical protein
MEGRKASRRPAPARIRTKLYQLTALSHEDDLSRAYLQIRSRISHAAVTLTPSGTRDKRVGL